MHDEIVYDSHALNMASIVQASDNIISPTYNFHCTMHDTPMTLFVHNTKVLQSQSEVLGYDLYAHLLIHFVVVVGSSLQQPK